MGNLQKLWGFIKGTNELVRSILLVAVTIFLVTLLSPSPTPAPSASKETLALVHRAQVLQDSVRLVVARADSLDTLLTQRVAQDKKHVAESESKAPARGPLIIWQAEVDSLKVVAHDSTELARKVIPKLENINRLQASVIANVDETNEHLTITVADLTNQNTNLRGSKDALSFALDTTSRALAKANDQIRKDVKAASKQNKLWGFIPEPSRKEVFVAGFIGGSIITIAASHH